MYLIIVGTLSFLEVRGFFKGKVKFDDLKRTTALWKHLTMLN